MYHFLALIWNAANSRARDAAAHLSRRVESADGWERLFAVDGMIIFALRPSSRTFRVYELPGEAGIVLGRLFPTNLAVFNSQWAPTFTDREILEFLQTGGRRFTEQYWGGYIAFVRQPDGTRSCVTRDSSGRLPCYRVQCDQINIIFSDVQDLKHFPLPAFRVNHHYVAAFIFHSQLQIRECGLHGVYEILAGESWEMHEDTVNQAVAWDPCSICTESASEDYVSALATIRSTTLRCVSAWASVHDNILLSLSGGLDSAIVLGCLNELDECPQITCINIFSATSGDDERRYAGAAALRAGLELVALRRASPQGLFDARSLTAPKLPKPTIPWYFNMRQIELINHVAGERHAESVWTGQGGDHIFYQLHTSLGAADYLARRGVNFGLIAAIRDSARLSREPYFSVAQTAWKLRRSKSPFYLTTLLQRERHFVNADRLSGAQDYVVHPWMKKATDLPKGKELQVHFLSEVLHRHRPVPNVEHAYEHHPLLSQPLVELCLRLPTYLLLRGGRERGLAREAFSDCVPREIIERSDKGSTTTYVVEAIRGNAGFIREILLDGMLVDAGIVDRKSLADIIVHENPLHPKQTMPLLACIAAELWLRSWQ